MSGERSPFTMPIVTGKNERYPEMIAFGITPVMPILPSTMMIMGPMARIGIVCEAMIQGIRLRSSVRTCTMPMARAMPRSVPKTNPSTVADAVTHV
jgi:hypothetical protein